MMQSKHFALVAGCLMGLGAMTSALSDWREALNPAFIGGVLGVIGTQVGAIFSERP